ncbi:hypothetical protein Daesc_000169 [Daldinia eschscholtzii]|uniref:RRN7-type domain-containing protein n=1 Tax=Daldinia eschscholtzii TaxID=292717 RepID=A0AAX6MXP5_9PEZI
MAPTKYHRFRGGERCDECGARQWYAQDAIRYCRNGHRLEGFAEHEGDEDAFGTQGKVSRKKKEPKKKVAVKLSGDEGRELYLEVLQLILLRQVWWLVREKGFPEDFEEIVRALWALRVRNLPLRESGEGTRKRKGDVSEESDGYASSAALFSSQSEGTGAESSAFDLSDATTATWAPDARRRWKLPKLMDSLALCYLGCLVRRLPATTADFCGWAQRGELDFLAAFNNIPRNVRDRLPAEYHRALQVRDHIPAGRLQAAVQELADYSYPVGGKRIRTMDNPEVLLIALVVVSAKLLYPLDGIERPPRSRYDPRSISIDWKKWQESMQDNTTGKSSLIGGEEYKVTPEEALTMNKEKLDDFMDWFEKTWIGDGEPKTAERIREPFMGQTRPSDPSNPNKQPENTDMGQIRSRYEAINNSMKIIEPTPYDPEDSGKQRSEDFCPVWRTPEELPDAAKVFYEKAASIAAIPLHTLVRGATQVERRLEVWCIQRAKERDKGKGEGKGKGKAVWTGDDSD